MPKASKILTMCAVLYNYVIDEDYVDMEMTTVNENEHSISHRNVSPHGMSYLLVVSDVFVSDGFSSVQIACRNLIETLEYRRPIHNVVRNKE